MTDRLPPNLLALFAPRPPLRWVPPCDHAPEQRRTAAVSGVAEFLPALAEYEREYDYRPTESWLEARDRKKREKAERAGGGGTGGEEGKGDCMCFFVPPFLFFGGVVVWLRGVAVVLC
jgi:U1 small nuclear ribonucleoprotein